MGRHPLRVDPGPGRVLFHDVVCTLPAESPSSQVEEYRFSPCRWSEQPQSVREPGAQRLQRLSAKWGETLLRSLSGDEHDPVFEVKCREIEPNRLGNAGAGSVEELEECPVTSTGLSLGRRGLDEGDRLFDRERLGERVGPPG